MPDPKRLCSTTELVAFLTLAAVAVSCFACGYVAAYLGR